MTTKSEIDLIESKHMLEDKCEKMKEVQNISQNSQEVENHFQLSSSEDSNESISMNENISMDGDIKEQQNKLDYVSENLDSALDSESNESDTTTSTTENRLTETITYQQKIIEQNAERIKSYEEKLTNLESMNLELATKLEQVIL